MTYFNDEYESNHYDRLNEILSHANPRNLNEQACHTLCVVGSWGGDKIPALKGFIERYKARLQYKLEWLEGIEKKYG